MIESLEISKVLYDLLNNKTDCNGRLYPIVAENGTAYPFMVYTRDNVNTNECKDGVYEDNISFTINVVASTYSQSVNIAQRTRNILCKGKIVNSNMTLRNITLTSASERYEEDAYIQSLQFTAIVTN